LTCPSGDELFLRFQRPNLDFFTFNTADLIKRSEYEPRYNCYGENSVPVVGAFMQNYSEGLLQVFPRFPIGVAFGNSFLDLHRNPENDDVLGLGLPLLDPSAAFHRFLVTFDRLNHSKIWKNYLNFKNPVVCLAVSSTNNVKGEKDDTFKDQSEVLEASLDLDSGKDEKDWKWKMDFKILSENECLYLSRVFYVEEKMFVSVLNICEDPVPLTFDHLTLLNETLMNGQQILPTTHNTLGNIIKFEINKNFPENIQKPLKSNSTSKINPFELKTFEISYKFPEKKKSFPAILNEFLDFSHKNLSTSWQDLFYFLLLVMLLTALPVFLILTLNSVKFRKKVD
jgi:hypothetical protein